MVLGHDMTRIVPGVSKAPAFRRGHVIKADDISLLLSMGKEHIYVMDIPPGQVHEEEAAVRISRAIAGQGIRFSEPKEGKVNLQAAYDGLLRLDIARLLQINAIGDVQLATARNRRPTRAGEVIAATRVTPLLVEENQVTAAERLGAAGPIVEVLPYQPLRAGIIVTGSEVFKGRVEDRFGPVVQGKIEALGGSVIYTAKSSDDIDMTAGHIHRAAAAGAELICLTGGMSVDPDDATPGAIRKSGARVVTYGTPVLPGSMFMLAYLAGAAVMGLPGAVMHDPITIFDYILARVMAGEVLTKLDFVEMGHGGLLGKG